MIPEIKEADEIINQMNNINYENMIILRSKLESCTSNISNVRVQGGKRLNTREEALLLLAEMTTMLEGGDIGLKKIYKNIPPEKRNLKIYFDKVYFNISNRNLEIKYGLTIQQINRIVKKIKKEHQCSHDVQVKC